MIAKDYINDDLPYLTVEDTIDDALQLFEESKTYYLPLIENRKFKGLIDEQKILHAVDPFQKLENLLPEYQNAYISWHEHIYNALRIAAENQIFIMPVLDDELRYIGSIDSHSLMEIINVISVSRSSGGIIVLAMKQTDYDLSAISRIVESSNLKILSSHVLVNDASPTHLRLTLKVNQEDISSLIADFERHQYDIVATFQKGAEDVNTDRLNQLFKYLDL